MILEVKEKTPQSAVTHGVVIVYNKKKYLCFMGRWKVLVGAVFSLSISAPVMGTDFYFLELTVQS